MGGLECLTARFRTHRYAPHSHDTYVLGVVLDGADCFRHGGSRHTAGPGSIVAINPGEVHDGSPAGESYAYRMLYPDPRILTPMLAELGVREAPQWRGPVIDDPDLAIRLTGLHRAMEFQCPQLERDQRFLDVVSRLVARHARQPKSCATGGQAPRAVTSVRDFIEANLSEDLDLQTLAEVAGLGRFRLLRAFKRELGLTPHAYLLHRRVAAAKRRIGNSRGEGSRYTEPPGLSEIAVDCGFFDQSHMGRVFKSHLGVTPGQYRLACR